MDRAQLEQVVMNLVLNARDASPPGATVHVRVRTETLDGERFVVVQVEDAGHGIPPEVLEHVFEPFFTTSVKGQGTGMGLATVLSIVEHCGGTVRVASEVGRGTVFTVRLPRTDP
jgi:signal transduction histidine kinase